MAAGPRYSRCVSGGTSDAHEISLRNEGSGFYHGHGRTGPFDLHNGPTGQVLQVASNKAGQALGVLRREDLTSSHRNDD